MGERTSYAPGTFSWAELATSDAGAAKSFYSSLFGWEYDDNPIPGGQVYSMASRDGKQVAALFGSDEPPHWNCYVTVASVDDAASRAGELGGDVMAAPFDVMELGRMAVIADPTGAALCLWEPRGHIGAALVNTPGALTWNDLVTPNPDAAARFYGDLFGWTTEEIPDAGGYRTIHNGDRLGGGIMPHDPQRMGSEAPPSWMPYFGHEDVDRLVGEVDGLGGRLYNGPVRMPQGSIAVLADPHGAVFRGEHCRDLDLARGLVELEHDVDAVAHLDARRPADLGAQPEIAAAAVDGEPAAQRRPVDRPADRRPRLPEHGAGVERDLDPAPAAARLAQRSRELHHVHGS